MAQNIKKKELKIVALDPAGVTGYCTNSNSGIWDLKLKPYKVLE